MVVSSVCAAHGNSLHAGALTVRHRGVFRGPRQGAEMLSAGGGGVARTHGHRRIHEPPVDASAGGGDLRRTPYCLSFR